MKRSRHIRSRATGAAARLALALALAAGVWSNPRADVDTLPPWTRGTLDIHQIATGRGNAAFFVFPDGTTLLFDAGAAERPAETAASLADYIAASMPSPPRLDDAVISHYHGAPGWQSVETPIARAIGPTDVHVVNHHGSIDPASALFLTTLRSRVIILPSWSVTHPSQDALKRLMTARLYPGPRDIFATTLHDATKASIGARAQQLAADHGHIVVRVAPGGRSYQVFVDPVFDARRVLSSHGPYQST